MSPVSGGGDSYGRKGGVIEMQCHTSRLYNGLGDTVDTHGQYSRLIMI